MLDLLQLTAEHAKIRNAGSKDARKYEMDAFG